MTAAASIQHMSRPLRVLLVEDNPGDAELISEFVTGDPIWPVHVDRVATLAQALSAVGAKKFDLILLDLGLPDSVGLETLKRLLEAVDDVPVTVLTGQVNGDLAAACIENGAQDYLAKEWINRSLALNVWNSAVRAGVEAELVEARNSMSHLLEQSPDGMVVVSEAGTIRFVNSAAVRLFEGRLAEGHPFPAQDLPRMRDLTIPRGDGSASVVEARAGRIVWDGELATVVTLRDVTERVRAQERIEHLNRVLRAIRNVNQLIVQEKDAARLVQRTCEQLVDTRGYLGAWIAWCDPEGRCEEVAQAGFETGFDEFAGRLREGWRPACGGTVAGSESGLVVLSPAVSCPTCPLRSRYVGTQAAVVELRHAGVRHGLLAIALPDGFVVDADERELLIEIAGGLGFARHSAVTQRQKDESETRYRLLVENALAGIAVHRIVVDEGGTPVDYVFLSVNPAFETHTGLKREDILGRRVSEVLPDIEATGLLERYMEVTRTGVSAAFEVYVPALDRHFAVSAYRVEADTFATIFDDISEGVRQRKEKDELEARYRTSQRLEAVGRLAGGVAHDFNNMLGVILGYGESLADGLPVDDPLREAAVQIVEAGRRSAALTRQLLAFSRNQSLRPEVLDLNAIVGGMERLLATLLGEDVELVFDPSPDLGLVEVDRGQFEQVIMNLAVNSRDAMPEGGRVTIETRNVRVGGREGGGPATLPPGRYAAFAVRDTGHGMDEVTIERVFEPFFTTKEEEKGTGLGLSTAYGIVKQSGGEIEVQSRPNEGAVFTVFLPVTRGVSTPAPRPDERSETPHGEGQSILVVDDEPALRKLFERTLTGRGYVVAVAESGAEAVRLVLDGKVRPALLLTDMVMPGMGGQALAGRLRQVLPDLKVIYMSGYTEQAVAQADTSETEDPFIQKPFDVRDLAEKIETVLRPT